MSKPKNNVWRNALQEQTLCEDLEKFNSLTNNDDDDDKIVKVERGVETYKYSFDQFSSKENQQQPKNHLAHKAESKAEEATKREEVKERLGSSIDFDPLKSRSHISANEFDSEAQVIKEILKQLNETNLEIITRCVKILGKKKALEILYATQDIEDNGGMFTSEGDRRRSPGGVYLQLIKRDETILNCQRKEIFIEDQMLKKKKKAMKRLRQRNRFEKAKKELSQKVQTDRLNRSNNNNNEDEKETDEEDEMDQIEEDKMIYFDE